MVDRLGPGSGRFARRRARRRRLAGAHRAGRAASACAGRREPVSRARVHRAGTPTAGYAEYVVVERGLRLRAARRASATRRPPRCCAPASSATGPCAGAALPPGGRLGIYGFGGSAHLAAQVAMAEEPDRPRDDPSAGGPAAGPRARARPAPATRTTRRPSRSTPPSSSPRRARWYRRRWQPWTGAARWPSPASTSATSRRSTTSGTCSRSARCAVSPPTPATTARSSSSGGPDTGAGIHRDALSLRRRRPGPGRPGPRPGQRGGRTGQPDVVSDRSARVPAHRGPRPWPAPLLWIGTECHYDPRSGEPSPTDACARAPVPCRDSSPPSAAGLAVPPTGRSQTWPGGWRARWRSSPGPVGARVAATPCDWPRRAPTSSPVTSSRTIRPCSTRWHQPGT